MKRSNPILLISLLAMLAACGGGGGGGSSSAVTTSATGPAGGGSSESRLVSGLEFREPTSFNNDPTFTTASSFVDFRGRLTSVLTPLIDCSGGATAASDAGVRIEWENLATGETGSTQALAGCVNTGTVFGVGLRTYWAVDYLRLELGRNEIRFLSYVDGRLRGEDVVIINRTDGTAPVVSHRYPEDGASGVPVNRSVVVRFNEIMLEASLHLDRLQLIDSSGNAVSGVHTYSSEQNAWVFNPGAELDANATYEVRINGRVEDQWGVRLGDDLTWSFGTGEDRDEQPPMVIHRWPDAGGCDCASPSTEIQIGFDEPMDPATFTPGSVALFTAADESVAARIDYRVTNLALLPEVPLADQSEYRVQISGARRDAAGNAAADPETWTFRTGTDEASGAWRLAEAPPFPLSSGQGAWTGEALFVWGAVESAVTDCAEPSFCEEALLGRALSYDPAADQWAEPAFEMDRYDFDRAEDVAQPFPSLREAPSLVWTGSEILLFGGSDDRGWPVGEGGAYDPETDSWRDLSNGWTDPATGRVTGIVVTEQATVWTGAEMILWGGVFRGVDDAPINRGWRYRPQWDDWRIIGSGPDIDDEWNLLPDLDPLAPAARKNPLAVWSGSELIVWGGEGASGESLRDGGRYDPATNSWSAMSRLGAPASAANGAFAHLHGDEMLIWNGGSENQAPTAVRTVQLASYSAAADRWQLSAAGWEPSFTESAFEVVQADDRLLAVGVVGSTVRYELEGWAYTLTIAAYEYDPTADRWRFGGEIEVEGLGSEPGSFEAVWAEDSLLLFVGSALMVYDPQG